jgi:hypothetical protein
VTLEGETLPEAEVNGLASSSNGLVAVGIIRAEEAEPVEIRDLEVDQILGSIWTSTDGST